VGDYFPRLLPPKARQFYRPRLPFGRASPISRLMTDAASNLPKLPREIDRRRTFAIISHPDAGKTTLTEKFLLYGGAIQMAGQVRAKGEARRTRTI